MENDSERMMMQMMANMMAGKRDEEPESCSSCRIDFFERENAVDNQAEGVFSRMIFKLTYRVSSDSHFASKTVLAASFAKKYRASSLKTQFSDGFASRDSFFIGEIISEISPLPRSPQTFPKLRFSNTFFHKLHT